jgi:hypothetical protein
VKLIGADEQDQANKEAERGEAQGVEAQEIQVNGAGGEAAEMVYTTKIEPWSNR